MEHSSGNESSDGRLSYFLAIDGGEYERIVPDYDAYRRRLEAQVEI